MTSRPNNSPVYQIDFTAVDSGKRIASSKRRIRWRFGFSNQDALSAGETGTACRGEEHDITLVWSISSGKRLVLADGQEVHYSNNRSHIFDFSWTMRGNHVLKVVAFAHPPMNVTPGFRQYDFYVDGLSFYSMPKVYRLGLTASAPTAEPSDGGALVMAVSSRNNSTSGTITGRTPYNNYSMARPTSTTSTTAGAAAGGGGTSTRSRSSANIVEIEAPHNQHEEEAYLAEAIKNSLKVDDDQPTTENNQEPEITVHATPVPTRQQDNDLLIDFMSEPAPTPATAAPDMFVPQSTSASVQNHPTTATQQPFTSNSPFDIPPTTTSPAPTAPPVAFVPAIPIPAPTQPTQPTMTTTVPSTTPSINPSQPPPPPPPTTTTTTNTSSTTTNGLSMNPQPEGLGTDADAAFAKFANMDQFDIISPSSKKDSENNRANPFDDVMTGAPAPTLAGMKLMQPQQQQQQSSTSASASQGGTNEKKQVMKSNGAVDPYNALVVSGDQNGNWGNNAYGNNTYGNNVMMGMNNGMNNGMNHVPAAPGGPAVPIDPLTQYNAPTTTAPTTITPSMNMNHSVAGSSITNSHYGSQYGGGAAAAPLQSWNGTGATASSSIPINVNIMSQQQPPAPPASTSTPSTGGYYGVPPPPHGGSATSAHGSNGGQQPPPPPTQPPTYQQNYAYGYPQQGM